MNGKLCIHVPEGRGVIAWDYLCVSVFAVEVMTLGCVCVCVFMLMLAD